MKRCSTPFGVAVGAAGLHSMRSRTGTKRKTESTQFEGSFASMEQGIKNSILFTFCAAIKIESNTWIKGYMGAGLRALRA